MNSFRIKSAILGATLSACAVGNATAGAIVGGSSILNYTHLTQLETWLGEGELTLTNIFTKNTNDVNRNDSFDWHAAVNGKGRTFSLFEVTTSNGRGGFDQFIFGGYNPQSWNSSGTYNMVGPDADRTAFIFNLTTGVKLNQCKSTDSISCGGEGDSNNWVGSYQTFNHSSFGPTFGAGHDLNVDADLNGGYNWSYGYGLPQGDTDQGFISPLDNANNEYLWVSVGALETFTIGAFERESNVPEPGTLLLATFGLLGLGLSHRKQKAQQDSTD